MLFLLTLFIRLSLFLVDKITFNVEKRWKNSINVKCRYLNYCIGCFYELYYMKMQMDCRTNEVDLF